MGVTTDGSVSGNCKAAERRRRAASGSLTRASGAEEACCKRQPCARSRATSGSTSEHRERLGAFDGDPGGGAGKKKRQPVANELATAQDGAVKIDLVATAIAAGEKTRELRVPVTTARITTEAKTNGRTVTEAVQKAEHTP